MNRFIYDLDTEMYIDSQGLMCYLRNNMLLLNTYLVFVTNCFMNRQKE